MQEYAVQCKAMFWTFLPIFLLGQCAAAESTERNIGNAQILTKCNVVRCKHVFDEMQCTTMFSMCLCTFLMEMQTSSHGGRRRGRKELEILCNAMRWLNNYDSKQMQCDAMQYKAMFCISLSELHITLLPGTWRQKKKLDKML